MLGIRISPKLCEEDHLQLALLLPACSEPDRSGTDIRSCTEPNGSKYSAILMGSGKPHIMEP